MNTPFQKGAEDGRRHDETAILVTGGSGFIGKSVVTRLADQGNTVVCMYHHRLPEPMANVYPVCSDMGSAELIAAPLRGVETVVHLAWDGGFVGPTEKVSWNLKSEHLPKNVKLLKNLIVAMERAGTKRLVFMSAIGACRAATTPFLQEKYLAEFFVLNSKIPEKIIVRSSVVCGGGGSNDKFLRSIIRVMQCPGMYPVPVVKQAIAPIHLNDMTSILCETALCDLIDKNAILEITGDEKFKVEELFKMVSARYGRGIKVPLKGVIGDSLLPLFERSSKVPQSTTKLRHYLALGNHVDESTRVRNPLVEILPEKMQSFRDILAENQSS